MPSPEFHHSTANRNKKTLKKLLAIYPKDPADNSWILTIAYYTALHIVDAAADTLVADNGQTKSHADRLDFLEKMGAARLKQLFNKMHILSEGLRYGTSAHGDVLVEATRVFETVAFRDAVSSWLKEIEDFFRTL